MNLKHIVLLLSGSMVGCFSYGQSLDARRLLEEDITRSANLHHNYEAPAQVYDSPVPKGYTPFYISHYGRHGSRYHWGARPIDEAISVLDSLMSHDLLTEQGLAVREDILILQQAHEGQVGYLTHKGAAQHQAIAHRMYSRYPQVFKQKDRREVNCAATNVQRCIQSMANFCVQLARENPSLDFTMDAGERFADYISNSRGVPRSSERSRFIKDSIFNASVDPSRVMTAWVKDSTAALEFLPHRSSRQFMYSIFSAGGIGQCLDIEDPFIYRHYTFDEVYGMWKYADVSYYDSMCATVENNRSRDLIGKRILKDILEKADAALDGGDHAADLRFGHDTGLSPLMCLLKVQGVEREYPLATAPEVWLGFQRMPMASNLQIVFYHNREGDVLVKFLFNEKETTIPSLSAVSGPYYKWEDVRSYFVSLLES